MEDPKKDSGLQQPDKWVRKPDSKEVYSNQYFLNWSSTDVRIRFGQMIPTSVAKNNESVNYVIEENVAVTMSWAQAKGLKDALNDAVARYESANGVIDFTKLKLPK